MLIFVWFICTRCRCAVHCSCSRALWCVIFFIFLFFASHHHALRVRARLPRVILTLAYDACAYLPALHRWPRHFATTGAPGPSALDRLHLAHAYLCWYILHTFLCYLALRMSLCSLNPSILRLFCFACSCCCTACSIESFALPCYIHPTCLYSPLPY